MRSMTRVTLVVLLLFCLALSIGATGARADSLGSASVTASGLNMRSEPSTDSTSVICLTYGTVVEVTGTSGDWYAVSWNGYTGYMLGQYLSFTSSSDSTTSTTTAATTSSLGTGTVTGSSVNVRSGPDTSYSSIGSVNKNDTVTITGSSGNWYQIDYNGQTGYIIGTYVSLEGTSTGSASVASSSVTTVTSNTLASSGTGTVTGNQVNVRSGPGTSYSAIGSVNKNDTVTITGSSGNWYQINYNGQTGYIISTYVSVSSSSSTTTTTTTTTTTSPAAVDTSVSGTGTINADQVRFRSSNSTSSTILAVFSKGTTVSVTGKVGDWYAVTYSGTAGYVYATYVTLGSSTSSSTSTSTSATTTSSSSNGETISGIENTAAYVVSAVNMRKGPDTSYTSLHVLSTGTAVTITGSSGSWYEVLYNGEVGYIYKSYLTTTNPNTTSSGSSVGTSIITEAKKYLGVPYIYGGTSTSGFDCSGFVYYVFRQCGYTITRTATAQASVGTAVSRSDLQPGDIVIFYNSAKTGIGHSGIYIGGNQFIHASSGGGRVMISSLSETYYNSHYYCARRVA